VLPRLRILFKPFNFREIKLNLTHLSDTYIHLQSTLLSSSAEFLKKYKYLKSSFQRRKRDGQYFEALRSTTVLWLKSKENRFNCLVTAVTMNNVTSGVVTMFSIVEFHRRFGWSYHVSPVWLTLRYCRWTLYFPPKRHRLLANYMAFHQPRRLTFLFNHIVMH
jgi:hypothetical protein